MHGRTISGARARSAGYHSAFHGEKSYNGVAILSKTKLADVRVSLCDEVDDPQARVIAATVGNVRVYSIYAPNGQAVGSPAYEYKLKWYARLQRLPEKRRRCRSRRLRRFQCRAGRCRRSRSAALARRDHVFGRRARGVSTTLRHRLARYAAIASATAGLFTWWDYRMLSFPKKSRTADRRRSGERIAREKMHGGGSRSRDAERERSFRSRPDLGRVRPVIRVSNPPPKPLIIWDGDCHFCRRWIERWSEITGDAVDYATSQKHRRAVSGNSAGTIRALSSFHRERWQRFLRRGSRLSIVAMSIFEKVVGLELRTRSWFRSNFGNRLQTYRG